MYPSWGGTSLPFLRGEQHMCANNDFCTCVLKKQNMDTQVHLPAALGLLCESEYCEHLQVEPVK